ncbi:MAG: GNAT family N-acetyltransferase [Mycetocola sp.]
MITLERHAISDAVAAELVSEYLDEREATFPSAQGSYARAAANPADFADGNGVFLVARDGDEVLGCGGVRLIGSGQNGMRAEVKHVFTRPSARGRGVARRLMGELERQARALGADQLVLDTNDSLAAAGTLYRALGFERTDPYNSNPNATAWYAKSLTAAGQRGR